MTAADCRKRADTAGTAEPQGLRRAVADTLDFTRHLPHRLWVLANLMQSSAPRRHSELMGLGIREWRVVALTGKFGSLCAADIVAHIGLDKATVSRAVSVLREQGLIELQADARDRRRALISLTDKGVAMHNEIVPRARTRGQLFESVLSEHEREMLFSILDKLEQHSKHILAEEAADNNDHTPESAQLDQTDTKRQ